VTITRTYVWRNGRPDDRDQVRSQWIARRVRYEGAVFELRNWVMRYPADGGIRQVDAVYDEVPSRSANSEQGPMLSA
jgi:hypothetical protein